MLEAEAATIRKITWRLVPLLAVSYFAAYLDRVNLSFAGAPMSRDLGFSASIFGLGAGIFFLGYVAFELPSNLALRRVGARRWFARIMASWGVVSLLFAFIGGTTSFLILRFLLGAAEAGFFPGVVLYLTTWFPAAHRARVIGIFAVALPASTALGAPLSGFVMGLDGVWGLHGWQWLFLTEALPSLALAVVLLKCLPDGPANAAWLAASEKAWLVRTLEDEHNVAPERGHPIAGALKDWRVWLLGLVYCGIVAGNYGISFWLPQIVGGFGLSVMTVSLLAGLPYAVGAIGMIWWSRNSDRLRERRWHVVIPGLITAIALVLSAMTNDLAVKMICLSVAGFGAFANLPVFWTLPSTFLSVSGAAAGIAVISSIGNVAGFAAPFAMGWLKDLTNSFSTGLVCLGVFVLLMMVLMIPLGRRGVGAPLVLEHA